MDTEAAVAAPVVKNSTDLDRQNGEPNDAHGPASRSQRRTKARISELLLDGAVREELATLDSEAAALRDVSQGSAQPGSLYAGSGSVAGSLGNASGKNKWRKLNKAVGATKVLAGRPKALATGRPGAAALQTLSQEAQDKKKKEQEDPLFALAAGAGALQRAWVGLRSSVAGGVKRMVIMPETRWYQTWWFYYAVAIAILSCWVAPFQMAFQRNETSDSLWLSIINYFIIATFIFDFLLKFFVAYFDPETGMLVTEQPRMAIAYVKSFKFMLDVLGCFPYDMVAEAIAASRGASDGTIYNLDWIKLLALARAYRILDLFQVLDYRMMLSQGTLMLLRNYIYVFFTAHWAACIFYHVAKEDTDAGDESWVSRNAESFAGRPVYEQYILALYFSVTVFTAMGDAQLFPFSITELALMIVYLLFNLFLGAYIIGTVTIMMVRADERSKAFRESMSHLLEYSRENDLPDRLHKAMKEHLEVHFDTAQSTDDNVLAIYPTTIRRRALRHLYLQPIKGCYVFRGCKQRFLDAVLTAARVELFLPGVEILTEGDNVAELLVVVAGEVMAAQGGPPGGRLGSTLYGNTSGVGSEYAGASFLGGSARPSASQVSFSQSMASSGGDQSMSVEDAGCAEPKGGGAGGQGTPLVSPGGVSLAVLAGKAMGTTIMKGCSDALAELAFFTDGASYETVVGTTPVRVLSLPKAAWELLVQQFPQQTRLVLENVQRYAETAVEDNLRAAAARSQLTSGQLHVALSLVSGKSGFADSTDPLMLAQTRDALTHHQLEMITRLDDIRTVAATHVRKCDEMRTFEFLNTAATNDVELLRTMLSQGISPNTADYDGRTGLMLAAAKGHDDTVKLLLDAGADKDKTDAFGISALAEAAKNARDSTIELLLSYGATLGSGGLTVAAEMCTAVFQDDVVKLHRLLRSGAPPDACDYDKRSPLHIAGAEGNLAAVKLLIEEGGADPNFQDRWGNTALDEARRVGAAHVMSYLESRQRRDAGVTAEKRRQQAAHNFMSWCSLGEVSELRAAGGYSHGEEAGCALSGLLVAASKGHTDVVEVLLEGMPPAAVQHEAQVAMLEAARMGHPETVAAFRAAGVTLPGPSVGVAQRYLAADLRNAAQRGNGAVVEALLAAGLSGRPEAAEVGTGSPLQLAVEHSHLGVTRRLVEHGGAYQDLASPDGLGRTPLQLAEELLSKLPADPRVRAVHEYLAWVTPLAAGSSSMQQLATAALERWGSIDKAATEQREADGGLRLGTPPGIAGIWEKQLGSPVVGLGPLSPAPQGHGTISPGKGRDPGSAGGGSRLRPRSPGPSQAPLSPGPGERLTLAPGLPLSTASSRSNSVSRPGTATTTVTTATTPSPLRPILEDAALPITRRESGLPPPPAPPVRPSSGWTSSTCTAGTATGMGDGDGASASASASAVEAVEAWDNLPGTPGNSTRGGSRAAQALGIKQREANAGGGEAATLYNASVLHSAALLNEPPPTTGGGCNGGDAATAPLIGFLSPVSGAKAGTALASPVTAGAAGGPGSAFLTLPLAPSMSRRGSGALAALAPGGGGGGGSLSPVASGLAPPSPALARGASTTLGSATSPVAAVRTNSSIGAASRLFGDAAGSGAAAAAARPPSAAFGLAEPLPAARPLNSQAGMRTSSSSGGGGGGGGGRAQTPVRPFRQRSSVTPVAEDAAEDNIDIIRELDGYMGPLADNASASGGGGIAGAGMGAGGGGGGSVTLRSMAGLRAASSLRGSQASLGSGGVGGLGSVGSGSTSGRGWGLNTFASRPAEGAGGAGVVGSDGVCSAAELGPDAVVPISPPLSPR